MSEPQTPPPLPPLAQPIPVHPISDLAHENQFEANDYADHRRRPGIITAIAIISITVGSLGLIGGGLSALYGAIFYFLARQTASMNLAANSAAAAAAAQPPPLVADDAPVDQNGNPVVGERGMGVDTRQTVIGVLASQRPLNDARKHQLHALLAKAGLDIFQSSGGGDVSSDDIRRAITQSGQLPRASESDPNKGPDFFVLATGRIEVSDDRALFEPSDHSQETIRVAVPLPSSNADESAAIAPASGISKQDVQVAVRFVNQQVGHRLTPRQRSTLSTEFSANGGLLIPPSAGMPIASQLLSSNIQPGNSVLVLTSQGQIQVSPSGIVQSRLIYSTTTTSTGAGGNVTTFNYHSSATAVNPFVGSNGKPTISGAAATLVISEAILSVLLSVYLLVIGILTLRQTPRGRQLHIIYALLKIPLAIVCGIGWCWIVGDFFKSIPNAGGGAPIQPIRAFLLVWVTGVAIIYPIGLLIAFSTPSVKRYYDSGLQ